MKVKKKQNEREAYAIVSTSKERKQKIWNRYKINILIYLQVFYIEYN